MFGEQFERATLLSLRGVVVAVNEDVGIEEATNAHGSRFGRSASHASYPALTSGETLLCSAPHRLHWSNCEDSRGSVGSGFCREQLLSPAPERRFVRQLRELDSLTQYTCAHIMCQS